MESSGPGVLGWGYEGKTVEDLVDFVRTQGVTTVVDVRLNAISRKQGFSKVRLREALEREGFAYIHMPQLGNPRDNRQGFAKRGTAVADESYRRFRDEVLTTGDAEERLAELRDLAQSQCVVLLCFEADDRDCHRSLVQDALSGLTVAH